MLPSHNCIIIDSMFSFQGTSLNFYKKFNEVSSFEGTSVNLFKELVGQNGLEPSTSRLSVVCSSQLSYWPIRLLFWWRLAGSNRWPPACKAGALPAELNPHNHKAHTPECVPSKLNNVTTSTQTADQDVTNLSLKIGGLLRKEVIQPHLPIRLPCYDFTPITGPTFGRALLAVRLRTSGVPDSHGVTGGVYKARERIHRGMLIRDY